MHCARQACGLCGVQVDRHIRESVGELASTLSKKVSKSELVKALSTKADVRT